MLPFPIVQLFVAFVHYISSSLFFVNVSGVSLTLCYDASLDSEMCQIYLYNITEQVRENTQ